MHVKTYRAKSLDEALQLVQQELGPDATVLQTRELDTRWWQRLSSGRQFEIRARRGAEPLATSVPIQPRRTSAATGECSGGADSRVMRTSDHSQEFRQRLMSRLNSDVGHLDSLIDSPFGLPARTSAGRFSNQHFDLLTRLVDAEIPERDARELIADAGILNSDVGTSSLEQLLGRLAMWVEQEITTTGPLTTTSERQRVIALVGPTGVGKTTTLAKLAANLRLREKRRVGLITVDTYRVASVEQLRTYAEIIDLPMEVVSTPREMRDALMRLSEQELVLIDTAGRGPHDELQLQELRSMLAEAKADEVHLVLSAVSSTAHLRKLIDRFVPIGITALLLTKLDEASAVGGLWPAIRSACLPLSYLTCGQTVPDDIVLADNKRLATALVGAQPVMTIWN